MFLRIKHLSRYDYSQPVSFAPHALYLRPAETPRQRLHHFVLTISPDARRIAASDALDNSIDWAYFPTGSTADRLEFRTELLVETHDANPFDFFLRPSAVAYPFTYDPVDRLALAPCLAPRPDTPAPVLRAWLDQHLPSPPNETVPLLTALIMAVHRAFSYARREEEGIQSVPDTLAHGSGSCRDQAVFLIEVLRSLGLAARFVSGYLHEPVIPGPPGLYPTSMHAWTEVYLPGAGWRGLDPTRGIFCDDAFVPLAHAAVAESVSPIQGTFIGPSTVTSRLTTELNVEKL